MSSIAWWPTLFVLAVSAGIDLATRRVPNWLTIPFLVAGLALAFFGRGAVSLLDSVTGIIVALVVCGVLCFMGGMGLGDLKLCVGVGAWIGPSQLTVALVVTGIVGGCLAVLWMVKNKRLGTSLDGAGDLIFGFIHCGVRRHPTLHLNNESAAAIPYAPAIAIGTLFSFFSLAG